MRITDQIEDLRLVARELPLLTDSTVKVLRPFDQGMPKNLFSYCETVDEKFINKNLALIDEIKHRDPLNSIPRWFREYQKYNFGHTDILNHDLFFKTDSLTKKQVEEWIRQNPGKSMVSGGGGGATRGYFVNFGKVLGSEIEVDGNTSGSPNFAANFLEAGKITTVTSGAYYNQMKINLTVGGGNVRLAVFDDNAGVPNNLKSESASLTASADYTTNYAITEVQLNFTTGWLAHNQDSDTTVRWAYWSAGVNRYYRNPFTFGAMPNPFGSGTADTSSVARMKIGYF